MSIKVVVLGQGLVATHFEVGLEKLRSGDLKPNGVPLAGHKLPYDLEDIEVVLSYDVDSSKIGRSLYDIAKSVLNVNEVPRSLKDVVVRTGVHLGTLDGLPFRAVGLEDKMTLEEAVWRLVDEWKSEDVDVVVNTITTEMGEALGSVSAYHDAIRRNSRAITASHVYAYALALYSSRHKNASFINVIPTPLANDPGVVGLYEESRAVVLGDDGATGATPLTADLLEHLAQRNRGVKSIAQFNIGGNTDFLALTIPERNLMKEKTKSSVVRDILGYDAPHFIKPTGYLEPLGDKKFVAMHIEYESFNEAVDEIYVVARINDSPALAGLLVDLVRLGKISVEGGEWGTVYPINSFYMKMPGPPGSRSISKTTAYRLLKEWLGVG